MMGTKTRKGNASKRRIIWGACYWLLVLGTPGWTCYLYFYPVNIIVCLEGMHRQAAFGGGRRAILPCLAKDTNVYWRPRTLFVKSCMLNDVHLRNSRWVMQASDAHREAYVQ